MVGLYKHGAGMRVWGGRKAGVNNDRGFDQDIGEYDAQEGGIHSSRDILSNSYVDILN